MKEKFLRGKLREKNVIATIIVILLTGIMTIITYVCISAFTREYCLGRMQEAADTVMDDVSNKFNRDSQILGALAETLALEEQLDSATMKKILSQFAPLLSAKNISILLPGDIVFSNKGTEIDSTGIMSFEEEAELGEHISNRMFGLTNANTLLIRHFVPIVKNGETVAVLYSSNNLSNLPNSLNLNHLYNKSTNVYLIDRKTGDMLIDTLHNDLGNISDFSSLATKDSKGMDKAIEEILAGKTGHTIFKSDIDGEYTYFYYAKVPDSEIQLGKVLDYNQWAVAVSVPEKEVMAYFHNMQLLGFFLALIEAVILIIYFIWTMQHTKVMLEKAVLEERLIKAENAERAKTMFLSNMSHDIRTPMNAIIGYTTLIASNIDNKERVQDYLSKVLSSSNHLLSLINDILDMSRIESGRVDIEETECSMPEILHDLRNILQNQMYSKQLNFYIDTMDVVDEDIWCDKLHLNQVLLNLLSNAIKFTPAGGDVTLLIKQLPNAPDGYATYEIRIKDTGIGMSPEFLEHVFEPFERERTSTISGIQGTGLGMAITKNIVDMMGGKIQVFSEQGKGTEYILTLDLRLQSEPRKIEVIKELEGLRALIVDDDFNICDSVTKMLVQLGMRAEWTLRGKEAVLHAKQAFELSDQFYAYIIDLQLPDMNGIEVVKKIRQEISQDVPIIILTAYDWSNIETEAREAGVTAFCHKPIFMSTLRKALVTALGKVDTTPDSGKIQPFLINPQEIRILLVEDNELNREIAEAILLEVGFKVEMAINGKNAVDMVTSSDGGYYNLILMDVQMPVMNGYEATKAIRALENPELAGIPIIAMTANAFNEDKKNALDCGMNDHIAKPIDIDKLFEAIKKHL